MTVRQLIEQLEKLPQDYFVTVCFGGAEQHEPVAYAKTTYEKWVSIFLGEFHHYSQAQIDGKEE